MWEQGQDVITWYWTGGGTLVVSNMAANTWWKKSLKLQMLLMCSYEPGNIQTQDRMQDLDFLPLFCCVLNYFDYPVFKIIILCSCDFCFCFVGLFPWPCTSVRSPLSLLTWFWPLKPPLGCLSILFILKMELRSDWFGSEGWQHDEICNSLDGFHGENDIPYTLSQSKCVNMTTSNAFKT